MKTTYKKGIYTVKMNGEELGTLRALVTIAGIEAKEIKADADRLYKGLQEIKVLPIKL